MTVVNPTNFYTPEDLLRLEDAVRYELVDGKLVERNMGMESSKVAGTILAMIWAFARPRKLGHMFNAENSYQCFRDDSSKVRKPDVSFIRTGRLTDEKVPKGHCPIPPDLAVEVVSPNDLFYDVEEKVQEYLTAGVPLVWLVNPDTRSVHIYRPASSERGNVSLLGPGDTLTGEEILPGFTCNVADLFE
jgi:Uma2 family endonuclease